LASCGRHLGEGEFKGIRGEGIEKVMLT